MPMLSIRDRLNLAFMRRLIRTPSGRAHVLSQVADAEGSGGEGRIFDNALSRVEDPELRRMIEKHRDDETRHEQLFLACLARTCVEPEVIPEELKLIGRLDHAMGGVLDRPIVSARGVMEAYLLLQ